jgi:iron complex outermembrane recepter protein
MKLLIGIISTILAISSVSVQLTQAQEAPEIVTDSDNIAARPKILSTPDPTADGEDFEDFADLDLNEFFTTVISASKFSQNEIEAPATVAVITKDEIRNSAARNIPELLRTVPGVMVFRSGPGQYTVSLRGTNGLQANNIIVMLDGLHLAPNHDGETDWAALPVRLEMLERIEVVRGPVSVLYGANAYTGVINLITKIPSEEKMSASITAGSDTATGNAVAIVGRYGSPGDSFNWSLGLFGEQDSMANFEDPDDEFDESDHRIVGVNLNFGFQIDSNNLITLNAAASYNEGGYFNNITPRPIMEKAQLGLGGITYSGSNLLVDDDSLMLSGFTLQKSIENKEDPPEGRFTIKQLDYSEYGGELNYRLPALFHNRFLIGASSSIYKVDSPVLMDKMNAKYFPSHGLYISDEFKLLPLILNGGLRIDFHPSNPEGRPSYRGSALYVWKMNSIRFSAGSAFRNPTIFEVGGRFTRDELGIILLDGNPDLEPPEATSYELALNTVPVDFLKFSSTVFHSKISNLIYQDFEPLAKKTYQNLGSREIIGAELSMTIKPVTYITTRLGYTYIQFLDPPRETFNTVGDPNANPKNTFVFTGFVKFFDERLILSLSTIYTSKRSYLLRVGVPPTIIRHTVHNTLQIDSRVSFEIVQDFLEIYFMSSINAPADEVESPYVNAAPNHNLFYLGLKFSPG